MDQNHNAKSSSPGAILYNNTDLSSHFSRFGTPLVQIARGSLFTFDQPTGVADALCDVVPPVA